MFEQPDIDWQPSAQPLNYAQGQQGVARRGRIPQPSRQVPQVGFGNMLLGALFPQLRQQPRPNPMNNIGNRIAMNMPLLGGLMAGLRNLRLRNQLRNAHGTGVDESLIGDVRSAYRTKDLRDVTRPVVRPPTKSVVRTSRNAVMPKLQRQVTPRYI